VPGELVADVFVSYKREDSEAVERLVQALRKSGLAVWWDRDIPPEAPWEASIEAALNRAKVVIVAWSPAAAQSENVKAEARWARDRGLLLQTYIKPARPPLFFGERQGVDLCGWSGAHDHSGFQSLLGGAKALIAGRRPSTETGYRPRRRRLALALALVGTGVTVAASAGILYWRSNATSPKGSSNTDAILSRIPGVWGPPGCVERGIYKVEGQRIIARWANFESVGQVVSVRDSSVLSETVSPLDRRGRLVELRLDGDRLVVHDRTDNVQVVLEKCVP
jgi:hypothetical protein